MRVCCGQAIYAFWQYDLCDVFIELTKPVLSTYGDNANGSSETDKRGVREALWLCLDIGLRYVWLSLRASLTCII